MKLAWITGANGLIGNYLVQTAPRFAPRWRVRALTRADFDLLDFAAVGREFAKDQPQLVIHCAAISAVGEAQKNPAFARRVNVEVTQLLAGLSAESQFVFFSTDLIFDGRKGNYTETDAPNPLHVYGETKVDAEQIVLKNPRHLVARLSINGGVSRAGNRGFNEQLAPLAANRAGDDIVHGRISFADSGGGDGAGGLGTGGEKLRGDLSRRRRGKIVALADRQNCWSNAGRK